MRLPFTALPARLLLAASLSLSGCNLLGKDDPPVVVKLALADSLRAYDMVRVEIADGEDTARVLKKVYEGILLTPSQLPACTLTTSTDNFLVKVRAYRGLGQLGVETLIFYEGGRKRVVHQKLPPLVPYNLLASLKPSAGSLDPAFSPSVASYSLPLAAGTASVSFEAVAAYSGKAVVVVGGDTARPGAPAKVFQVGSASFVVPVTVIDLGTPRTYQVEIKPAKPRDVGLDSVAVSAGTLVPAFDPTIQSYEIALPANVASVDIACWPIDPGSMTIHFMGVVTFPGSANRVPLEPGAAIVVNVGVTRGSDYLEYTFLVSRGK